MVFQLSSCTVSCLCNTIGNKTIHTNYTLEQTKFQNNRQLLISHTESRKASVKTLSPHEMVRSAKSVKRQGVKDAKQEHQKCMNINTFTP